MRLFDSSSSARTDTTTQNAAFSEIGGAATSLNIKAGGGKKSHTTINALDGGAIAASFDFAKGAQTEALKQVELAGAGARALVKESIAAVSENARTESENVTITIVKWGVVAVVAYALFRAFKG